MGIMKNLAIPAQQAARNEYKGWKWFHTERKHAPNYGGEEYWTEITFRKDGKELFATGTDTEDAIDNMRTKIDYLDNPKPPTIDPTIPF